MEIARRCLQIESLVPKDGRFIRVSDLATALDASIVLTPLFVEATLASNNDRGALSGKEWVVLLDSEMFEESTLDIETESPDRPLSVRLRNSIAHELTHILGFKGESARSGTIHEQRKDESQQGFIGRIERDIEATSPLLLIPEKAVESLMGQKNFSMQLVLETLRQCHVSREVLISRLGMAARLHKARWHQAIGLNNAIIGVGIWNNTHDAAILRWPTFVKPSGDRLIPEIFQKTKSRTPIPFADVISDKSSFLLGGELLKCPVRLTVGTIMHPSLEEASFLLECEPVERRAGKKFLFSFTYQG